MAKQTTLLKEVSVKGIGLHSGKKSKIDFKPAASNTGIQFIRVDIPAKTKIEAVWQNAQSSKAIRGTVIAKDNAEIYTIEHILSCANGLGIDNLIVEINNSEPPILDGSARLFAEALADGGLAELDCDRQYFIINEPFVFETKTSKYQVLPSDNLSIDCSISFDHPFLKEQNIIFNEISRDLYLKEIAPAKTFCFDFEIEYLQKNKLALGGSFDNAIVIGAEGILNKEPLRFADEFVRHKIVDLIGDIYLAGKPLKAKIIAQKPGHKSNINFVKELVKKATVSK